MSYRDYARVSLDRSPDGQGAERAYNDAMKSTRCITFKSRTLAVATFLTLLSSGGFALADSSVGPNSPAPTSGNAGVSSTTARDRNDTVRSNETRLNTVGRGVDPAAVTKLSRGDRRFLEKAAKSGLAELRVARLAVEHSSDPRVRSFAQQLVSDHEKSNAELSDLAGRKGVSLPQDENDRNFKSMSDKTGLDFDKTFVGHMVDEHQDDIDLCDAASRKSDDAEVAAFASKQLPILQEHHRIAQDLERSLKR